MTIDLNVVLIESRNELKLNDMMNEYLWSVEKKGRENIPWKEMMIDWNDNRFLGDQLGRTHYLVELLNTNVHAINDDFQNSKEQTMFIHVIVGTWLVLYHRQLVWTRWFS